MTKPKFTPAEISASVICKDRVLREALMGAWQDKTRKGDLLAYFAARISALEDRLAVVDGGSDASSSKHAAWKLTAQRRAMFGEPPLCFTLADAANGDVVIEWAEEK